MNGRSVACYLATLRISLHGYTEWVSNMHAGDWARRCTEVSFCTTLYLAGIQTEVSVLNGVQPIPPAMVDPAENLLQLGFRTVAITSQKVRSGK